MAVTAEEIAWAREVFQEVPDVTTRKMFGGLSLYSEGTIFAIIGPDEELLIKAKGDLAEALEAEGSHQWVYDGHKDSGKKPTVMPYWSLPDSALDDPEEAAMWARRSLAQNA
ncbi:TfoX/Sxy family protein [Pseudaestuariivita sp.]|uniref:TfoX/Sxy family protein n=1 Tax=Pseudaestuariivita sp. TaxID=2211669 RepID=UPI004057CDED